MKVSWGYALQQGRIRGLCFYRPRRAGGATGRTVDNVRFRTHKRKALFPLHRRSTFCWRRAQRPSIPCRPQQRPQNVRTQRNGWRGRRYKPRIVLCNRLHRMLPLGTKLVAGRASQGKHHRFHRGCSRLHRFQR